MTLRFIHKWLGICIGVQVFIWVFSGTVISFLDHQIVAGRSTRSAPIDTQSLASLMPTATLISSADIARSIDSAVMSISLVEHNQVLAYRFNTQDGPILFDVESGERLSLRKADAQRIALQSYAGTGAIVAVERLANSSEEISYSQAVWKIQFDDVIATRVYVSEADGSIIAHRNRYWKVVDFLLMLHFMDYAREQNFNNPQIIVIAFISLWLSLSGLLLVFKNFSRRDFTKNGLMR